LQRVKIGPGVEDAVLGADDNDAGDGGIRLDAAQVPVQLRQGFEVEDIRVCAGLVEPEHAELSVHDFAMNVVHINPVQAKARRPGRRRRKGRPGRDVRRGGTVPGAR
jgi:hypothetical protein